MNYNNLCAFVKVYEKGNMTAASRELHLSQPCLTLQIKALEEYYNIRLFDRTSKGVNPTNGGRILYQYAKEIINLNQEMENQLSKLSHNITGRIRIGSTETSAAYILPPLISAFKQKYPKTQLYMSVSNSQTTINRLLDYSLDLGIVPLKVRNKKIINEFFIKDRLVFIASRDSIWAKKKEIKLDDILRANILLREEGSNTRELFLDYLRKNKINTTSLNLSDILGSNESIKSAVEQNMGVSIASEFAICRDANFTPIVALDVVDFNLYRDFYFIHRKESVISEPAKVFIKCCQQQARVIAVNFRAQKCDG